MGLLGGSTGVKSSKPPVYTCLQVQTSAMGLPIPIFWGAQKIAGNCIGYFGFTGTNNKKGSGGKGGKSNTPNDYTASVVIALAEGATAGYTTTVGRIWVGVSETTLEGFGGGIFPGTANQAPWAYGAENGQGLAYAYTTYYAHANLDLGSSASLPNINFELFSTFNGYHVDNANTGLPDANFGDIIPDFLTNPRYGVNLDPSLVQNCNEGGLDGSGTLLIYNLAAGIFVSPLLKDAEQATSTLQRWANVGNFWIYWSGTAIICVPLGDQPITAHGVTFTPNVTPIYDLGPDDFVVVEKNGREAGPPVTINRKDPADGYNQVQLNCSIRTTNGGVANSPAYQDTPFRWQDSSSIDHIGVQAPNVVSSTEICNVESASVAVALIGQRAQYIRNEYVFKLGYYFLLLLPGDIVTLTEPNTGLAKFPVRIKQVDEDNTGNLAFIAEEFVYGVGTANIQEFEPGVGMAPYNATTPPGPINPPAFVQPDPSLTGGQAEIWIAISGGANVGGAGVFVSFDAVTYTQIGETATPSLQGTLTAALPAATGLDTTNTLAIDLSECLGVIPATATEADAEAYRTLCLIDDELVAYGMVTPSGEYTANLTFLERGLYGSTPAAHAVGAPFARIDPTKVFQYALPPQYVGQPIYFQFPTVNLFGSMPQSLADCVTYEFTPSPLPVPVISSAQNVYNPDGSYAGLQVVWTQPGGPVPTSFVIGWNGTDSATAPAGSTRLLIPAAVVQGGTGSGTAFEATAQAVFGYASSPASAEFAVTGSPSLPALLPGVTAATAGTGAVLLTWTPQSGPAPSFYRAFFWIGSPGSYTLFSHQDFAAPASSGTITGLPSGDSVTLCVVTYNAAGTAETFAASPSNQPQLSGRATVTTT